jgi:SRSO17 transposase
MTTDELRAAAAELTGFHQRFAPLFGRPEAQEHSRVYLHGLLMSEEGKSAEPMALCFGERERDRKEVLATQRFLTVSPWEGSEVQREIQAVFFERLAPSTSQWPIGTVGVIDESAFVKSGTESVGVKRQWCGRLGKQENCQVGVFLVGTTPSGSALLDHQLYLPVEWAKDKKRREQARVPDEITFQTKPQIAVELLRRTRSHGLVRFDWITADETYGRDGRFREALEADCQRYLLEVPVTTTVWTVDPATPVPPYSGRGRPPQHPTRDAVQSVQEIAESLPPGAWEMVKLREGAKGPLVFEFARVPVWVVRDGRVSPPLWLLVRRGLGPQAEVKYYLSNADRETPLEPMAMVSGTRWRVEEYFEDGKSDLGMADYQARAWTSWHHHMSLVALAHLYVTLTRQTLKKKSPELTLPMALRLLQDALSRSHLDKTDAMHIVDYYMKYNPIARHSHRKSWLRRHKRAKRKLML